MNHHSTFIATNNYQHGLFKVFVYCPMEFKPPVRMRQPPKGLVFHSDRGPQYTSQYFRDLLEGYGIRASMGDVGACWDNAVVERFFWKPKA